MDRTLSIFISSAIGEFANERKALKAALESLQLVYAWVFELETAYSEPRDYGYLHHAAEADIFILIIGDQEREPVEREFATALGAHRPILAFVKRSAKEKADALFAKYCADDQFKYAIFDDSRQLQAQVVEAIRDEITIGYRKWPAQARQLVQVLPRLSQTERDGLDHAYLAEVVRKYEFWRTHYTPLAAIARLRDDVETSRRLVSTSAAPPEFLPRGFDVLLREKYPREREERGSRESKTEHYDDLRDAVEKYGDLILLGDPGAGKTTTLWRLMYDYATRASGVIASGAKQSPTRESGIASSQKPLLAMTQRLPVLISLGRYDGISPILDFLRAELVLQSKADSAGNAYPAHRKLAAHLDEYLEDGRVMLLFDALNEMPQAHYSDSIHRLEQFRDAQRGNRFLFACRALDYTTKLDLPEATIQELDDDAQKDFLTAYFADTGARLFDTLHDSHKDLLDIGHNPYMLLMIGQVYQLQGELPSNRGLLFQSFVNVLMERELKTHSDCWLDAKIQIRVLSDLAFAIQREHGHGTSVPREWADKYLTGSVRVNGRDVIPLLLAIIQDGKNRWEAAKAISRFEARIVLPHLLPMLKDEDRYAREDAALVLGELKSEMAVPYLLPLLKDQVSDVRRASIEALGEIKAEVAIPHLIPLLKNRSGKTRAAAAKVLGVDLKEETAIPYLIDLLYDKNFDVVDIAEASLLEINPQAVLTHLPTLLGRQRRRRWHIPRSDELRSMFLELELLQDYQDSGRKWMVVTSLLGALREETDKVMPYLIPLATHKDHYMRQAAAWAMGYLKAAAVLPYLAVLCRDRSPNVRISSALAICKLGSAKSRKYLIPLLRDKNWEVRTAAVFALGRMNSKETCSKIMPLLNDKNWIVRWKTIAVLGTLGAQSAIPTLMRNLIGRDTIIKATVEALGKLKAKRVISKLSPLLDHQNPQIRKATAQALFEIASSESLPYVISLLKDENADVRAQVIGILGRFQPNDSVPHLLPRLKDRKADVRRAAIRALGKKGTDIAFVNLIPMLKDREFLVRYDAKDVLKPKVSEKHLSLLTPLLSSENAGTRDTAFEIIEAVKRRFNLPKDYQIPDKGHGAKDESESQ